MVEEEGTAPPGQGESAAPGYEDVLAEQSSSQDDGTDGAAVAGDAVNDDNQVYGGLVRCI